MKVLGIRNSKNEIRLAIVTRTSDSIVLENYQKNNRCEFPKEVNDISGKIGWLKQELDQMILYHKNIDCVVIKIREYSQEKKADRVRSLLDGGTILWSLNHSLKVNLLLNSNLGKKSPEIRKIPDEFGIRTTKYWNSSMIDAVVAGLFGLGVIE